MNNPLVSIILPTYNGARAIGRSIESIFKQSFSDWELIIVNDYSKDNTEEIILNYKAKDSRIIYLRNEENLGIQKSLNKGLKNAKGDYIARIDDDDEWIDFDKLREQVEFFSNNKNYVLIGTGTVVVDENGKELYRYLLPEDDAELRNKILTKNCFTHSSVLFRKEIALKFGGYSEEKTVRHIEDYDLWLKMGTVGKLRNLPRYAVSFMLRQGAISSRNKIEQLKKIIKLIRNYKDQYPNYCVSFAKGYFRLLGYYLFICLPFASARKIILKINKERW